MSRLPLIIVTVVLVGFMMGVLAFSLPEFGALESPSRNEVFERYVRDTVEDTGAVNSITAVVFDYRAFDTLGEATVLFTAAAATAAVLSHRRRS
jgi:multisubunit Na+/H+ antiporter MnhB subunit